MCPMFLIMQRKRPKVPLFLNFLGFRARVVEISERERHTTTQRTIHWSLHKPPKAACLMQTFYGTYRPSVMALAILASLVFAGCDSESDANDSGDSSREQEELANEDGGFPGDGGSNLIDSGSQAMTDAGESGLGPDAGDNNEGMDAGSLSADAGLPIDAGQAFDAGDLDAGHPHGIDAGANGAMDAGFDSGSPSDSGSSPSSDGGTQEAADGGGGDGGFHPIDAGAMPGDVDSGVDTLDAGPLDASVPGSDGGGLSMMPDFDLIDVNTSSATFDTLVSPRDYIGRVTAWYFGHAT